MIELEYVCAKNRQNVASLCNINLLIWKEFYFEIISKNVLNYICSFINLHTIKNEILDGINYFLIKENDNIIGFVSYFIEENIFYLNQFYIEKSKRNKGLGLIVFNKIKEIAINSNSAKISSFILKDLKITQEIFTKFGFKKDITMAKCIGNDWYLIGENFIYELN